MLAQAWESFQMATGLKEPPPPPPPPPSSHAVADLIGDGVSSSAAPLLQLCGRGIRHLKAHRSAYLSIAGALVALGVGVRLIDGILSPTTAAAAAKRRRRRQKNTGRLSHDSDEGNAEDVAAALSNHKSLTTFATAAKHQRATHGTAKTQGNEDEDEETSDDKDGITFVDPAQSRFTAAMNRIKKQKATPFFAALKELQALAAEREALVDGTDDGGKPIIVHVKRGDYDRLCEKIDFKAHQTDELLTQYVVSLDGLPVGNRPELKQQRKEAVTAAVALADAFSEHLPRRHAPLP